MIWAPSETEAWEASQVVSNDATSVTVTLSTTGNQVKLPKPLAHWDSVEKAALDQECTNLVDLESFNEGIILHHIKKRFLAGKIYTYVGNILIAVNPYKSLDIYGPQVVDRIYDLGRRNQPVPPHAFSIAGAAVRKLREEGVDQSILISGINIIYDGPFD